MRFKGSLFPFIQVIAALLLLMSFPKSSSHSIKGIAAASLAPFWEQLQGIKQVFKHTTDVQITNEDGTVCFAKDEIRRLRLENQLLINEIQRISAHFNNEAWIVAEAEAMQEPRDISYFRNLRNEDQVRLLNLKLQSVPASVIFRSPSSWTNSFWINVGNHDNQRLGKEIISKNSPVVVGASVAGVIDYVGNKQSRVRLITDSGLTPSVRVMRTVEGKTWYLAKGELKGSKEAAWRTLSPILKGVGFNYDFPDVEGPARDLRSGEVAGYKEKLLPKLPIIEVDDLLITTGMDGVFPRGLQVAKVKKINLLKEGDYFYEIEAVASVKNLDDLTEVYVLPTIGYDPDIQAPHLLR